ncbi:MAG TPA: hypothetical protein VHC70_13220 [Phycisphaerales bacterium]|nr:hypothetical protein [Phycisphaerales bacterium]
MRALFFAASFVLVFGGGAVASVTFTEQDRSVSATSFSGTSSDAAPNFLPWTGDVQSIHRFSGTSASAFQMSELTESSVTVDSSINAKDGQGPNGSSSESLFRTTFSVDQAGSYALAGSWSIDWDGLRSPSAVVKLTQAGNAVPLFWSFASVGADPFLSDSFSVSGELTPGTYELIATITEDTLDPDNVLPQVNGELHVALALQTPAPGGAIPGLIGCSLVLARRRRNR